MSQLTALGVVVCAVVCARVCKHLYPCGHRALRGSLCACCFNAKRAAKRGATAATITQAMQRGPYVPKAWVLCGRTTQWRRLLRRTLADRALRAIKEVFPIRDDSIV